MRERRNLETNWGQNPTGNNQQDPLMRKAGSFPRSGARTIAAAARCHPRGLQISGCGEPDSEMCTGAHVHLTRLQVLSPWSSLPPATILAPIRAEPFHPPPYSPPPPYSLESQLHYLPPQARYLTPLCTSASSSAPAWGDQENKCIVRHYQSHFRRWNVWEDQSPRCSPEPQGAVSKLPAATGCRIKPALRWHLRVFED